MASKEVGPVRETEARASCGERLCRQLVHGVPVIPVRVEHVLVHRVALLCVDLAREGVWQSVERLLDRHTYGGTRGLLLASVEY